jgi:predicted nucleic acid-binding protein
VTDACFVDTVHYLALLNQRDALHEASIALSSQLESRRKVTSDPVLVEVLTFMAARGAQERRMALALVDALRSDARTTIVRQTPRLFDRGLDLYRVRPDKGYSLTDCMSMVICRERRIHQVLTHDRHFEEGFEVLL